MLWQTPSMADPLELVYEHGEIADLDPAERRLALRSIFSAAGVGDVAAHVARAADEIDGFGPISHLMRDGTITDILIDGVDAIWVERSGDLVPAGCSFDSIEHLTDWCERSITRAGGRVDGAHPIADARLSDGSRIHVVMPPIAPNGPLVSIRRFPQQAFTLDDLVACDTLSRAEAAMLRSAVGEGRSIVVSGATGSGKTTLLRALLAVVPAAERVIVIEELSEIGCAGSKHVSLVARAPNAEGKGEVSLDLLVRGALRMRPDRIVVGEVRGSEALPALWAMRTGHAGTMLSVHASGAASAARRLVDLALMSPAAPTEASLEREVSSGIDIYVHMCRRDGARVVDEVITRG